MQGIKVENNANTMQQMQQHQNIMSGFNMGSMGMKPAETTPAQASMGQTEAVAPMPVQGQVAEQQAPAPIEQANPVVTAPGTEAAPAQDGVAPANV